MQILERLLYGAAYVLPSVVIAFAVYYLLWRRKRKIPQWQYAICFFVGWLLASLPGAFLGVYIGGIVLLVSSFAGLGVPFGMLYLLRRNKSAVQ